MNEGSGQRSIVWSILKIGARRSLNRVRVKMARRRSGGKDGPRRAAAPRRSAWGILALFLYAVMLAMAISGSAGFLGNLAGTVSHPGQIGVSSYTYQALTEIPEKVRRAASRPTVESSPGRTDPLDWGSEVREALRSARALEDGLRRGSSRPAGTSSATRNSDANDPERAIEALVESALQGEAMIQSALGSEANTIHARLMDQYRRRGPDGFYPRKRALPMDFWPSRGLWPSGGDEPAMLTVLTVTLSVLMILLILYGFSEYGRDLSAVHWSTEWYFTFPVRARSIFLADVLQGGVLNFLAWITVFPLTVAVFGSCGYGLWAVLPAAVCTLFLSTLAGAVCMLGETWMRRGFNVSRLRSIQATCTLLTTVAMFGLMIVVYNRPILAQVAAFAGRAADWPEWIVFLPTGLPLLLARSPGWALAGAGLMAGWTLLAAAAATRLSERMVRTGLIAAPAHQSERRGAGAPAAARSPLLHGVLGREVRLLLRDRTLLANTVIMPICLAVFQMFFQYRLLHSVGSDFRHTAAFAFGVGCYMVLTGGIQVLISEGRSLWMLYTFPRGLEWVLLRKVGLWACFASVFAAVILIWRLSTGGAVTFGAIALGVLAIWGVATFAFIDCGIGILNCTLPKGNEKPRLRPAAVYLCMILASMYAGALYSSDWWSQVVWAVLFVLVAAAIWQLVRDRIGYLLDETAQPPPALSVAHGLVAAFAFFAVQSILLLVLLAVGVDKAAAVTISYAAAGAVVAVSALLILRRVPDLWRIVGLRGARSVPVRAFDRQEPVAEGEPARPRQTPYGVATNAILLGMALGAAAGAVAVGYLHVCRHIPSLWKWMREGSASSPLAVDPLLIVLLAVVAAPLVEEFIFRGLLLRGLERMGRPALAVLGSAAIFAVVHPPVSALPVFVLGLAAAVAFRRTGLLLAPVAAHATYNAIALLAGWWLATF